MKPLIFLKGRLTNMIVAKFWGTGVKIVVRISTKTKFIFIAKFRKGKKPVTFNGGLQV